MLVILGRLLWWTAYVGGGLSHNFTKSSSAVSIDYIGYVRAYDAAPQTIASDNWKADDKEFERERC
jgi:hypothetical protein